MANMEPGGVVFRVDYGRCACKGVAVAKSTSQHRWGFNAAMEKGIQLDSDARCSRVYTVYPD
jgi:hypothetical protein